MRITRTATAVVAAATLVIGPLAGGAVANGHMAHGNIPPHPHVRLLDVQFSENEATGEVGLTYRKCIGLANGRILPLHSHHAHLHFGRAGEASGAPATWSCPWHRSRECPSTNCAELARFLPPRG